MSAIAGTPHENIAPTEPEMTPGGGEIPDLVIAQAEVLRLESLLLRRLLMESPAVVNNTFGQGSQAEFTFLGDQRDPFNGVAILNPTGAVVYVGFQAGGAIGSSMVVFPGSYLVIPRRFVQLSLAVSPLDAAGATPLPVTALRLRMPPTTVEAGPLGSPLANSMNAINPGSAPVIGVAGQASVVAANPLRREITVTNAGATGWVTLALGPVVPVMYAGIPLAPGGGVYWSTTYGGPISMIAAAAGTVVSIAEE